MLLKLSSSAKSPVHVTSGQLKQFKWGYQILQNTCDLANQYDITQIAAL